MARRILALVFALIAIAAPVLLLGALYLREHVVPPKSSYESICLDQYTGPPCASLERLYTEGAVLCVTGAMLLMLAILLAALLLLRLTQRYRLAAAATILATTSGASALWLSQQALRGYQSLSLMPWSFPAGYFEIHVARTEDLAHSYLVGSAIVAVLLLIVLLISLALLWGVVSPDKSNESEIDAGWRLWRGRALLISCFALLAPAIVLGMIFELARPAPCAQNTDPACFSLDAMVAAGVVIRGAGIVLVALAITLGCSLFLRSTSRLPFTLSIAVIALASGLWLMWFSQRVLDDYVPAPWNAETYPPHAFDGRVEIVTRLAQTYILWGIGAVALASVIALASLVILHGGTGRDARMTPPAAAL
jgi:hypothetical protein